LDIDLVSHISGDNPFFFFDSPLSIINLFDKFQITVFGVE